MPTLRKISVATALCFAISGCSLQGIYWHCLLAVHNAHQVWTLGSLLACAEGNPMLKWGLLRRVVQLPQSHQEQACHIMARSWLKTLHVKFAM